MAERIQNNSVYGPYETVTGTLFVTMSKTGDRLDLKAAVAVSDIVVKA